MKDVDARIKDADNNTGPGVRRRARSHLVSFDLGNTGIQAKVMPFMCLHSHHLIGVNERIQVSGIDGAGNQVVSGFYCDIEAEFFERHKTPGVVHEDGDWRRKPLFRLSTFVLPHMLGNMMVESHHSE